MASIVASASKGVMDAIVDKLNGLIADRFFNLIGVPDDIAFLKDELSIIRALINNLEDTDGELNPLVKNWRDQAREMAYDIEDLIDDFMNKQESADANAGFLNKLSHYLKNCRYHHETASQINDLKTRLREIHERRKRIRAEPNFSPSTTIDPRVSALFNEAAGLVGIDGPKEELLNQVVSDPSQQLKVLSIAGFGGLGKTTLANAVYREIGGQFYCKAFVSVSQKPAMTTVLYGLLSKLTGSTSPRDTCSVDELIGKLKTYLLDKKYLIVVDDLWSVREWEHAISCALPQNNKGSRVIVTTRDKRVARACSNHYGEFIYNMKSLSNQDSRKLFFNRIFGPDQICPPELEGVSDEILKKCNGLPLAIITIASILACEGSSISQKMQWEFIKTSLAAQLPTIDPTLEGMMYILNLSYKSLPRHLKQCFLYLGLYPEDYEIRKAELVTAWVVEGFVSQDMAEGYFNELVNRSVIQPADEWETCEEWKEWKVHDMMRDLILRRCEEDNFISVLHDPAREVAQSPRYEVRRLSMNLRGVEDYRIPITLSGHLSHLRCLSLFGTSGWIVPLSEFKFLRMLFIEISWPEITLDLTDVSQLSLLRYLKVKGGYVDRVSIVLPDQIRRLRHLEVLELPWRSNCNIPSDFDLPRLSHLTVPTSSALPVGIGNAKSLRTMHGFCLLKSSSESIEGLGELTNLQKLAIINEGQYPRTDRWMTALSSSLEKLGNLKKLRMHCDNVHFCADAMSSCPSLKLEELHLYESTFSRVPTWMGGLRNLRQLWLGVMQILQEDVDMIGTRLQSLVHLSLRIPGVTAERIVISGFTGFPVLKFLHLDWDGMSSLTFEAGAMPELQKLHLVFTSLLRERDVASLRGHPIKLERYRERDVAMPAGLQHLSKLKVINAWMLGTVSGETKELIRRVFNDHAAVHPNHPVVAVRLAWSERRPEVREDGQERFGTLSHRRRALHRLPSDQI